MSDGILIPNRFELLIESPKVKATPTLLAVESDLRAIDFLVNKAKVQGGGVLAFLLGATGVGKSTAAYSATVFLADKIASLVRVPLGVKLRDTVGWLTANLPAASGKIHLVLYDGREVTDDQVGLRQFLAGLNQLLRVRGDIVFLWPTTDLNWHGEIKKLATMIGGTNFVPPDSDIVILGPPKAEWGKVLERILIQLDTTMADVALDVQLVADAINANPTIGEFLSSIGSIIAARITKVREIKTLPGLFFVGTSGAEIVGEANRIRRAGTFILKAEELLGYSPRSEAGKWWLARKTNPEHHLAYIISLFDARLATMTASSVAYACLHHGAALIADAAAGAGMGKNGTNASTTLCATDLYRLLAGEAVAELTSSRKGKTKDTTADAFAAVQELSAKHHRLINEAIVKALAGEIADIDLANTKFEVDGGDQNLYTDSILARSGGAVSLEFHHISEQNCGAAGISAYVMDKLRAYAIHYNLVPR